jgi:hypothetical protein
MASQYQNIRQSTITNSSVHQVLAGRDAVSFLNSNENQVIIDNTFLRLFGRSESPQVDWEWARLILEKKQLPEIRKRLVDTLGLDRILMDVSAAEQPTRVNRSPLAANRRLSIKGEDHGILKPHAMLAESFGRDDIAGKLLILGAPGSGKTTALLSLAEQLICGAIAQPKTVIPVLFELPTWDYNNQSIEDWLVEQLYLLYGGDRRSKIYERWLEKQVLLPLLDGLDELGQGNLKELKDCTVKLNEFGACYPQLVICCRTKEIELIKIELSHLRGAVSLQPLSDFQLESYLHSIHRSDLWTALQTDTDLEVLLKETEQGEPGLLRVPLFIKLYAQVHNIDDPILSKESLLEDYIESQVSLDQRKRDRRRELNLDPSHLKRSKKRKWAYRKPEEEPTLNQTCNSLSWIARQLVSTGKTEISIEEIQPSWLGLTAYTGFPPGYWNNDTPVLLRYRLIFRTILGIAYVLAFALFLLNGVHSLELGILLVSGLGLGWFLQTLRFRKRSENELDVIELSSKIASVNSPEACKRVVFETLHVCLFCGLLGLATYGLALGLLYGPIYAVIYKGSLWTSYFWAGIIVGLLMGALLGIIFGLTFSGIPTPYADHPLGRDATKRPNQGTWNSMHESFIVFALSYPFSVLICMIPLSGFLIADNLKLLQLGFLISSLFSLSFGPGRECIKHLSLRLVLWQSGIMPWNVARFLSYCVERGLLFRVGGRYRFLHRELLDYLVYRPIELLNDKEMHLLFPGA